MTYNELLRVIEIGYYIKPKDVKIRFQKKQLDNKTYGYFYINSSGIKTCLIYYSESYITMAHTILHEISHSITYKKEWYQDKKSKTFYLREYKAEKLLRKICKEYNLQEILDLSNKWINKIIQSKTINDPNYYKYMAFRIKREEKI